MERIIKMGAVNHCEKHNQEKHLEVVNGVLASVCRVCQKVQAAKETVAMAGNKEARING